MAFGGKEPVTNTKNMSQHVTPRRGSDPILCCHLVLENEQNIVLQKMQIPGYTGLFCSISIFIHHDHRHI